MRRLSIVAAMVLAAPLAAAPVRHPSLPPSISMPHVVTTDNNASCDITVSPAATLLLPYFEVDVAKPVNDAANTIFTVVNTSRQPQIARVTIWTDYGYPAIWFNVFLTGYDSQPISLYDVIVEGALPATSSTAAVGARSAANNANPKIVSLDSCGSIPSTIPENALTALRAMLTTGANASSNDCHVGSSHANAAGYITIDLVNSCSAVSPLDPSYYSQVLLYDNVLTGDYEHVFPDRSIGNFAGGSPLVHIKAIPEGGNVSTATPLPYTFYDRFTPRGGRKVDRRQPLPSSFASRYIQGGTGAFYTDFTIWREGSATNAATCASTNSAIPTTAIVRFDDAENPTASATTALFPSTSSIDTKSSTFPPMNGPSLTGWFFFNLDNQAGYVVQGNPYSTTRASQNWIVVRMKAEGRYGVDYDATPLANGCGATSAVASVPKVDK
jgi:hypothetical protein